MSDWRRWLRGSKIEYRDESGEEEVGGFESWIDRYAAVIRRAHADWGFAGFFIYGKQGSGKTTLALKLAKKALGSWERALNHLFFDPLEIQTVVNTVIERMQRKTRSEDRLVTLIWDDAGVWASKYFFRQTEYAMAVQNLVELARRVTASIIITATAPKRVLSVLREQEWYFISLTGPFKVKGKRVSYADIYTMRILPTGKVYLVKKAARVGFYVEMPDYIRSRYTELMVEYMRRVPSDLFSRSLEKKLSNNTQREP